MLRTFGRNAKCSLQILVTIRNRKFSVQTAPKLDGNLHKSRTDPEWRNAKPFDLVPGPSKLYFLANCFPGGKFSNLSLPEFHTKLFKMYGPLVMFQGIFKQLNILFTFDPESFQKIFRTEGQWPLRIAMEGLQYYREHYRPDIYKDFIGIGQSQGKEWGDVRTLVNPIMLKPKNVNYYIPLIDKVASEFKQRILEIRDPVTLEVPANFENITNRWALESIGVITLNTRLGLLDGSESFHKGEEMMKAFKVFFQILFELEHQGPTLWKYYETPTLKKLVKAMDTITDITLHYVKEGKKRLETEGKTNKTVNESILAQLLKVAKNENVAMIMVMDLLVAGVDTTSSGVLSTLFHLAKNPEKQERLREEVMVVLPNKDSVLTEENMKNLPYLRAVIKEVQRVAPVAVGTARTTRQDLVLNGYQVPKGTNIVIGAQVVANMEKYVPNANKFLPERWMRAEYAESCPHARIQHPFVYIPFGFGPRTCIGKRMALLEMEIVLLRIIRNFKIEWHYPDMTYRMNLVNTPTGDLKFKFIDLDK